MNMQTLSKQSKKNVEIVKYQDDGTGRAQAEKLQV
jgi:hypothetical protein